MRITTSGALRRNLDAVLDQVVDDHAPVLITRQGGKPPAVLMSLEEFSAYDETFYLLASPRNAGELRASIAELERGGGAERELIE